jgi:segregation and condensation protein B
MTSPNDQLTLKRIIGALLFAAKKPITAADLKKIFVQTAEEKGGEKDQACGQFSKIKESNICAALEQIKVGLIQLEAGINLAEVAGGFRLQTDPECSPWLRQLLNSGRPSRLSKPALESLAIIAYRQPVTRAEIEGVRGVNVDNIVRHLLECQLIKIAGRSNLPGHPLLYGTTQLFLEHFGLQDINHLPGIEQLRRKEAERIKAHTEQPAQESAGDTDADDADDEDEDDEGDEEEEGKKPEEISPAQNKQSQPEVENKPSETISNQ